MRVVLQRVARASVVVDDVEVGAIGTGLLALVGVARGDVGADADRLAAKTASARVFPRGDRPFDLALADVGGAVLCVSQFTLLGDMRRGNRPSWSRAADPEPASALVDAYAEGLRSRGIDVRAGVFGAHMRVELVNDGPVTLILDTEELAAARRGG